MNRRELRLQIREQENLLRRLRNELERRRDMQQPADPAEVPGPAGPMFPGQRPAQPGLPGDQPQFSDDQIQQLADTFDPTITDTVDLVAYDLSAEPDQTYRYRVTVRMTSPLFARPQLRQDQRDKHYEPEMFLLSSESSDWSQPVEMPSRERYFVSSADVDSGVATVQIFRYHNGAWRSAEFDVRPGDPIGMPTVQYSPATEMPQVLDFTTGLFLVDVIQDSLGDELIGGKMHVLIQPLDGQLIDRSISQDQTDMRQFEQEVVETSIAGMD